MSVGAAVRARAQVVARTLEALTDDASADVSEVVTIAAAWNGLTTPLALAAKARAVETIFVSLADECAAYHAVRATLSLARLAMSSATAVSAPRLRAPLDAATRALIAAGWSATDADLQVCRWLTDAIAQEGSPREAAER